MVVYLGYGSLVGSGMLFADIPVELLTDYDAMLCSSIITQFKSYVNAGYNKSNQKIDSSIITKRPMVDSSLLSLFDFFRLF